MSEEEAGKPGYAAGGTKLSRGAAYTTKDFQLEVLGQLAEMQALAEELRDTLAHEAEKNTEVRRDQEQSRLLRFDGRTLVAIGAIALSLTGYVLQDARNSTKRDAQIDSATARITNLERVETANTEGRIKLEVELGEVREGQAEIKTIIQGRENTSRKASTQKTTGGQGRE